MSPPKPSVGALFDAALQLPREQRNAHVQAACAGDDALRQRVQALLAAHEAAGSFMEEPAAAPRPGPSGEPSLGETRPSGTIKTAAEPADEAVGQTIGRYKLRQKIGEGGCGVVYVADQALGKEAAEHGRAEEALTRMVLRSSESLDFVSAKKISAPFLVAVTVE